MRKGIFIIFLFTVFFCGIAGIALLEEWQWDDEPKLTVEILSDGHTEELSVWKNEWDEYYVFLPSYTELSQVRLRTHTFRTVRLDGLSVTDGMTCENIQLGHTYGLVYNGNDFYFLTFLRSDHIPTMYIDTGSGNMDYIHEVKGNKEAGTMRIYDESGTLLSQQNIDSLQGRGNATWLRSKKPYSITLDTSCDLLGMGSANRWILLANAYDYSNLRNKLAYDLANEVGLAFSPECQWLDLYLNGEYAGLYLLSERNEVHSNRVDIPSHNSFLISMELHDRLEEQNQEHVQASSGASFRIHYSSMESAQIEQILQRVENAILAKDGTDPVSQKHWNELIDVDSWARKYLIEEIFANYDAGAVSQYFYYTGDGKLYAGPVWDFDNTLASQEWQNSSPQAILAGRHYVYDLVTPRWLGTLYEKDAFREHVVSLYREEFLPKLNTISESQLDAYIQQIRPAAYINSVRRNAGNFENETDRLMAFWRERLSFLNSLWLEENEYHYVHISNGFGSWSCFAVQPDEVLTHLPSTENVDGLVCLGWFDTVTGEPFDVTQPICQDAVIQLKWASS